jgi:hypothetical protein
MDRFGASIQATLFTEMIIKWENILITNRVYLISKAFVEQSNPKFATVKNPYSLIFEEKTKLEL